MNLKTIFKGLFIILIITVIYGCNEKAENNKIEIVELGKKIGVFNFDNKQQLAKYNRMNLDNTHPNLINPQISKSDHNLVMETWKDLHQRIGLYLYENGFNWGVEDSSIEMVRKIYFNKNGEIENYFFNVLNENVTEEKKELFANLISDFAKDNSIEIERDGNFAQCGKTRYLNK